MLIILDYLVRVLIISRGVCGPRQLTRWLVYSGELRGQLLPWPDLGPFAPKAGILARRVVSNFPRVPVGGYRSLGLAELIVLCIDFAHVGL